MIPIPDMLAVMVLSECNLLPHSFLPLFLFEKRYRLMLNSVLGSSRMFCIGMRRPDAMEEDTPGEQIYPASTLGVIRACVRHPDGTSHLILQGMQRIRFVGWEQATPFRISRIEAIASTDADAPECRTLAADLTERARTLVRCGCADMTNQLDSHLASVTDPEILGDLVAYNFICDPHVRQGLIAEASVPQRLTIIRDYLDGLESAASSGTTED